MEEYNMSIEDENEIINNHNDSLEKAKKQAEEEIEKEKEAERERQRQKEEEAKQKESESKDNTPSNNGSDNGNSESNETSGTTASTQGSGNEMFSMPTSGSITSGFGSRESHCGIGTSSHNDEYIVTASCTM